MAYKWGEVNLTTYVRPGMILQVVGGSVAKPWRRPQRHPKPACAVELIRRKAVALRGAMASFKTSLVAAVSGNGNGNGWPARGAVRGRPPKPYKMGPQKNPVIKGVCWNSDV